MSNPRSFKDVLGDEDGLTSKEAEVAEVEAPEVVETTQETETEAIKPFAEKPELKGRTPEELDAIYDDWQKKYTQTRQQEKAELKELRTRLAAIEKKGDTVETPQLQQAKDQVQEDFDLGKLTVQEYTEKMKAIFREDARAIAREEFTNLSKEQNEQTYQEEAFEGFISMDERFNENGPEFNKKMFRELSNEMGDLLDQHIADHGTAKGFDWKGHATKLIQEHDAEIDEIVKKRTQQSTQAAKMRAAKMSKSNPKGTTVAKSSPTQGKSFRDILAEQIDE